MQPSSHRTGTPTRSPRKRPSRRAAAAVMWTAIALSLGLFGLLLALGWGDNAATIAAGLLLLTCVAVCIWAGFQGRFAEREVTRAVARLAATREQNDRREQLK